MRCQSSTVLLFLAVLINTAHGATSAQKEKAAAPLPAWIVATTPTIGATDVDPKLTEITVTFDRDMEKGMSWTGGKPFFPPADADKKAHWRDKRTCVLPVKLACGEYCEVAGRS